MHPQKARSFIYNSPIPPVTTFNLEQFKYLQPIVTQYLVCNKSEIWP